MATATETPSPHRKPWEEANPFISGVLAFLVPGLGHLYQGRVFKGLIYLVCIHAAFFTGMALGEGMTVHHKVPPNAQGWRQISLSYAAQVGSGIWALPALVQARRVESKDNHKGLSAPITSSFKGLILAEGPGSEGYDGPVIGTIALKPTGGPGGRDVEGKFTGTLNGKPVEYDLADGFEIDRPIGAPPDRGLKIRIHREPADHPHLDLTLVGVIPRPLWNWYEVPPTTAELQEITGRLGKYFELALVFTWIAGLLNVLAVWDCVKGPSLGFGDEQPAVKSPENKEAVANDKPPEVAANSPPAEAKGT